MTTVSPGAAPAATRRPDFTLASLAPVVPYAPAVAIFVVQLVLYPLPAGVWLLGFVLGMLGSLVALGLALVQRANRVINFAQADLGTVPTAFAYGCITTSWALPWLLSFAIGLVGAVVLGALVEFLLIRRFFKSSRRDWSLCPVVRSAVKVAGETLLPAMVSPPVTDDVRP